MNKTIKIILVILAILSLMFIEYRFIMHNQQLARGENGTIYSTVFGMTDTYYVDGWQEDATTRIMNELYDAFIESDLDDKYTITKDGNTINIAK